MAEVKSPTKVEEQAFATGTCWLRGDWVFLSGMRGNCRGIACNIEGINCFGSRYGGGCEQTGFENIASSWHFSSCKRSDTETSEVEAVFN
jgi:hypothetical protein